MLYSDSGERRKEGEREGGRKEEEGEGGEGKEEEKEGEDFKYKVL